MAFFCKTCGSEIANNEALFCKFCGSKFSNSKLEKTKESRGTAPPSLWRRFFAHIIDQFAVFPILFALGMLWALAGLSTDAFSNLNTFVDWSLTGLVFAIYMAVCERYLGWSAGKWFLNIKVADVHKHRINFRTAFLRNICKPIPIYPFIAWFVALQSPNKQTLHDKWFKTLVLDIHEPYVDEALSYQPRAWQKVLAATAIGAFVVYFSSISIEEKGADEFIREGVRNIQNKTLLNKELFGMGEDDSFNPYKEYIASQDSAFGKQLETVVSLVCERDNGDTVGGSGILFSPTGIILTNNHVVEGVTENYCLVGVTRDPSQQPVYAYYADTEFVIDGEKFTFNNSEIDTAFIRIVKAAEGYTMPTNFPYMTGVGSSDKLDFNDKIYVIGYPSYGGETLTLTEGVMSGRLGDDYIKTSAKIDAGNSGGAAINEDGVLIGIPTMVINGRNEGLGYILGIDSVKDWLDTLGLDLRFGHQINAEGEKVDSGNFFIILGTYDEIGPALKHAVEVRGRVLDTSRYQNLESGHFAVVDGSYNSAVEAKAALKSYQEDGNFMNAYVKDGGSFHVTEKMLPIINYFIALEHGNGSDAVLSIIPSKQETGSYTAAGITRYYSNLHVPFVMAHFAETDDPRVFVVAYSYAEDETAFCSDVATVYLEEVNENWYIEKIVPKEGC